jgi:two-component system, NtrC family, response regulator AtoC
LVENANPCTKRILIVSNGPRIREHTATLVKACGYVVEQTATVHECAKHLQHGSAPHLILLDMDMEGVDTLGAIRTCRELHPGQKIVALSFVCDAQAVAETIRAGALDYVVKPFDEARIYTLLKQYLSSGLAAVNAQAKLLPRLTSEPPYTDGHCEDLGNGSFFIAASACMRQLRAQLALIARVDVPVLVLGESGVGKEIAVRLIHKMSPRAAKPLLKVNCAALPPELLESELFGYEPGAFTGAVRSKPGKFELCDKGAIFLDEIGEMSPALQAKLLHVLQDGRYSRLGGRSDLITDVRVFAATNIRMQEAIKNKMFREDLYYRLNAFTVTIPPLRERREEIPSLFRDFMKRYSDQYEQPALEYSAALAGACMQYHWPGNIREFENLIKRYVILRDEAAVISELLAGRPTDANADLSPGVSTCVAEQGLKHAVQNVTHTAEAQAIAEALGETDWNRKAAAANLRISYKALLYKIKQFKLRAPANCDTGESNASDELAVSETIS